MMQLPAAQQATMSSVELCEMINQMRDLNNEGILRHDNLMAKIPKVIGSLAPSFEGTSEYANGAGHTVSRRVYNLPKREACLVAMSYSYELQARVFDRMTELENVQPKLPQTMAEALRLAADQAEQIEQQQKAIEAARPAVEFVDTYVHAESGNKGFRQVAKLLKAKEPDLRAFLSSQRIMYKLGGEWMPYQNHIDAGRFDVKTGTGGDGAHVFNQAKFTPKGVQWIAGLWGQYKVEKMQRQ